MEIDFILEKAMVKKIVAATGAVLVIQWGYTETQVREWRAEGMNPFRKTATTKYNLTLVVPDSDPRIMQEWHNTIGRMERPGLEIRAIICRHKEALKDQKRESGHFSMVYRLGFPLYNGAPDLFPIAGAGCRHPTTKKPYPGIARKKKGG